MLSFLLHHANRSTKEVWFYSIKDKLLKKYAISVGYDIQHIAGKICNSCGGKGEHPKYGHNGKIYDWAECYHCQGGWYKWPQWICLEKFKWGKYIFHRPLKREFCVKNPFSIEELGWEVGPVIEGYIEHSESKYSYLAVWVLYAIYDRRALYKKFNNWIDELGRGWYCYWWYPRNWLNNIIYTIRHGKPGTLWRKRISYTPITPEAYNGTDDMPF